MMLLLVVRVALLWTLSDPLSGVAAAFSPCTPRTPHRARSSSFSSRRCLRPDHGSTRHGSSSSFSASLKVAANSNDSSPESDKTSNSHNVAEEDDNNKYKKEAEELRRRARELMAEAREEEAVLRESRSKSKRERITEGDAMITHLFNNIAASEVVAIENSNSSAVVVTVANRLRQERWSKEQLLSVMDRLHERQTSALGRRPSPENSSFQIGGAQNAVTTNETEYQLVDGYIQSLVEAASTLDEEYEESKRRKHEGENNAQVDKNLRWSGRVSPALKTRLKELRRADEEGFKRRLAAELNAAVKTGGEPSAKDSMMGYMRRTLGQQHPDDGLDEKNVTRLLERVAAIPMWVPSSILPFVLVARTRLDPFDVKAIQNEVLRGTEFYCTGCDSISTAAVYRGNVRTATSGIVNSTTDQNQTAVTFEKIQTKMEQTGLAERVQLFFLKDPEWRPRRDVREPEPRPVILALPKTVAPEQKEQGMLAKFVVGAAVVLTLFSIFAYCVAAYALNPDFYEAVVNQSDLSVLISCIPLFLGILALQVIHEAAHYFVAKRSQIKIGLPIPLPSLQVGTFGSITPLRSFPSNRAALLDFALSGPVAQMVVSMMCLVFGILATVYSSADALTHFPVIPVALLKSSFLTGTILTALAPKTMMLPLSQPIAVHPLFIAGFAGLITSALNLLPIGRVDGGRACTAVFGSRFSTLMSFMMLLLLALLSLTGSSTISIFFGALVVLTQRNQEIPVRNDVTDVDNVRVGAYVVSLTLALLTLAPFPGGPGFL